MNIEEINRKHYFETDMYYRVGFGVSSKLLSYDNGIIHLEVILGRKWTKTHSAAAFELANCWKESHAELKNAVACKVYIIDTKAYKYKRELLNTGVQPDYDAKKGVIFREKYLN